MKVAIVILNWNGKKLLQQFLPSVLQFSQNATIYVADNASSDDSISFLKSEYPSVEIIQNSVNGGYAKGYNDALKNLSEDIFVLLNSDVEVTINWLVPIIAEFQNDESLVAAQPKILDYKDKSAFEYAGAAGGYLDSLAYPFCRGRIFDTLEKDSGQYNDIQEIFWASGACLFVRKDAFEKAGRLDEDYFAHQEEIDLCWRLKSNGGKIKYIGTSTVYHVGGATLSSSNPQKTFYNFRNSLLNIIKNIDGIRVFPILLARMLLDGIAGLQFLFTGKPKHFIAVVKAHLNFYVMIPKFISKRKVSASKIRYAKVKSIVYQHFVLKRKHFNQL